MVLAISLNFFGRKSNAPASKASSVALAPECVNEENIIIAVGACAIICLTASMPFSNGISISMVITSGLSAIAFLTASKPFIATSITSSSGSLLRISVTRRRKKLESSTTNTLKDIYNLLPVAVNLILKRIMNVTSYSVSIF